MTEDYIKSKIKGREVVYYLTTEEDLNDIKTKSIFGDIFILLFSLSVGGVISIVITKATSTLTTETGKIVDILNIVLIFGSFIFAGFATYFYVASFKAIKRIKGSGEIKSFSAPQTTAPSGLEIIEAMYWTSKVRKDITTKLKERITDNKLHATATNDIDGDPDPGTPKKLTISYKNHGTDFIKEYNEGDKIELP